MWVSGGDHDGRQNDFINEVAVFHTYGSYADPPELAEAVSRRLRALAAEGLSPWAKLGPVVFRTRRVRVSAREIRIEAVTRDDDVYAALQRLADRRRSGDLHFTHDLSSLPVRVVDIATDELARRYGSVESVAALAEAAGMSLAGLQRRLRRIGVPPRRAPDRAANLTSQQIGDALNKHGSISATARALGVGRAALTAQAQRAGILSGPPIPDDLGDRYRAGTSIPELARHYDTGSTTIIRWLEAAGVPRRPRGRQPRDG